MSDAKTRFLSAVDLVDERAAALTAQEWSRPSPCAGWDARHVLVHVTGTLTKVLAMVDSGHYAGSPAPTDEAPDAEQAARDWASAVATVRAVIPTVDVDRTVQTPRGPGPLGMGLALPTADCAVHAWDLAASAGHTLDLPAGLLDHVRAQTDGVPEEQLRSAAFFGPAVEPPADASQTDRLMAWLGRSRP